MRKFATWLAAVAALAFIGGPANAQAPKAGGTLNFAISAETPHYDPHGSDTYATLHFAAPFYSTLLRFNLDKFPQVEGDLAQSWEVAPDLMTYTFKLQPNVKFHDGTPLTSADVKATYDRLRNPPQGVVSTRKATFGDIDTIETPDPLTVVFKMKNVNAAMLEHFASPWNTHLFRQGYRRRSGSAAHQDQRHRPLHLRGACQGQPRRRQEEPGLFQEGPALSRRLPRHLHATGSGHAERGTGRTGARRVPRHFAGGARPPGVGAWATRSGSRNRAGRSNLLVVFNTEKKPFDDVRVRKALLMAIDRWGGSQGLSRISTLRSVGGVIRPGSPIATPEAELVKLPGFSKDIKKSREEAKKLLAEAGVPNLKLQLWNRNLAMPYTPAGIFLVDQWRQIGVEVEHVQSDTGKYLATMSSGQFDVAIDFSNLFMDDSEPRACEVSFGDARA